MSAENEIEQLEAALTALEAQRPLLGDAVVDAAVDSLRDKLAALNAQTPPAQQRKQATVLFADVSGFTALSEALDPEVVTEVMNDLWALVDRAITDHGGRIDKHIGDAVMALWGAEAAQEDDPEQAVRAALDVQAAVATFTNTHGFPLALRIGVNTGPVLMGPVGTTGEFTAMGDTVNVASRLEHAAPTGGVLISHDTYRHIRGVFDVLAKEPIEVKGKAQPVQTYIVRRAKPRAFRMATRGVEGVETRMIGRDAELLALQDVFHDVIQTPETRLVTVIGEAGVGKSRLLYEFENWIELRPERITYFKGRATPDQSRQTLRLVRDLFAFRFEILDNDEINVVIGKFRQGMGGVLEPDEIDIVGHWLGFDFSGSPAVKRLLGARDFNTLARGYCIRYLRSLAQLQPVLLLFEDIHWADNDSLDLINDLMESLTVVADQLPLLFVCLARPAFFERWPNWGEGQADYARIYLKPLSVRAGRELVAEILQRVDHVPDGLRDLIVDNAEGNPFYVEELIKMLIDEQVIISDADQWRVAGRLDAVHIPATLTGLLQARLDTLPAPERDLLQRASVVGRLFWDSTVASLLGTERDTVTAGLRAIRGRELIYRRERSTFLGSDEYIFKHALLRDVTYETVLLQQRREYHRRVAGWLEDNAGDRLGEYLSLIAEHYALASESQRAAEFWERAGDRAWKIGASFGSQAAYEQALKLGQIDAPGSDRANLMLKLGRAYMRQGRFLDATASLTQVVRDAAAIGDLPLQAQAQHLLAWADQRQGNTAAAKAALNELMPLAREVGGQSLANGLILSAHFHMHERAFDLARAQFEESLALARAVGAITVAIDALTGLGSLATILNDTDSAERAFRECRSLAEAIGDQEFLSLADLNLGNVYYERGEYAKAREQYRGVLDFYQAMGNVRNECLSLLNLAFADLELGDLESAERAIHQALGYARRLNIPPELAYAVLLQGKLEAKRGNTDRALVLFGLVGAYKGTWYDARRDLEVALDALAVGQDEKASGLAAGAALDFETVVGEILAGDW